MRRQNVVRLTLGILLTAGGCSVYRPTPKELPSCAKAVGGGLKISYEAPEDGVCYLVDQRLYRLLITETIETGSTFEFDVSETDPETLKRYEIEPASKLVLYFAPKSCLTGQKKQP
ncbi:MAG TPA: hypothetical protein PKY88_00500 [Anaerohalosphaeraceae bacterium]|nr:hypothetical protein [Anaerohalosphaeraceae bacterium]